MGTNHTITLSSIQDAQNKLKGVALHTALLPCPNLSKLFDSQIYLKMENLQRTGSFKLRGAYNKVANLPTEKTAKGIVASSAGNHAQGVALAAKKYGVKATICMPSSAPLSKINATQSYGAEVVLAGQFYDDAYKKALELQETEGYTFCHPFNDPDVIAGQGTIALEILEDAPDTDVIVVPIGGGGLISGIAIAAKAINPNIRIIGVQTDAMPSMKTSVDNHELTAVPCHSSLADGIAVSLPGDLTYEIVKEYVDEIITVTEPEIAHAILFLLETGKTASEGAGACPTAALLSGKLNHIKGKKVVLLVSGGNIDMNRLGHIINNGLVQSWRKVYMDIIVPDQPFILSTLSHTISESGANILAIHHDRTQRDTCVGSVHVSFELETIDEAHVNRIMNAFKEKGYPVIVK